MSAQFRQFIDELPPDERHEMQMLCETLQNQGDMQRLSETERARLSYFAKRFTLIGAEAAAVTLESPSEQGSSRQSILDENENRNSSTFVRTPFVSLVRETLNSELCSRGGNFADAVLYAYHNKWLPDQWKDETFCTQLFTRHQREIENNNAYRAQLQAAHTIIDDKRLAVGLSWFHVIFRLQQLLDQGVDLDRL